MKPERIILIPPTHEQSLPSFHVNAALAEPFVEFLRQHGIHVLDKPPQKIRAEPHDELITEIAVEAGTSVPQLEGLLHEFLSRQDAASLPNPT